MRSLKRKLAVSYGLLIVIILAVSAWAIYHLVVLGRAVDVILLNNYKSIIAAENMKEALERQDSAALFFIAGHPDQARAQFAANAARFRQEFEVAANNITEPGEDQIVAQIDARYSAYKQELERFISRRNSSLCPSILAPTSTGSSRPSSPSSRGSTTCYNSTKRRCLRPASAPSLSHGARKFPLRSPEWRRFCWRSCSRTALPAMWSIRSPVSRRKRSG